MLTNLKIFINYEIAELLSTYKYPFQLINLSLGFIRIQFEKDYKNLVEFLEPQAKTLKELEIGVAFLSFSYEFVLASMTKLNTFEITLRHMHRENAFYEQLEVNRSITTLIFDDLNNYIYDG